MPINQQGSKSILRFGQILYLLLVALSFYLLLQSRTGEARTIWEALHPAFIPTLFVATSLLFAILLASENVAHGLLCIILHSVLVHSLFSIIFPAGDLSGQQMALGRSRLVFDNAVVHGLIPRTVDTVQSQLYSWFSGLNFQAALSVVFARMFSIDLLYVHLFLVPVLWGTFTPIALYLVTCALTKKVKAAMFSGFLFSAFPYATYFGAISVPNSVGFISFFCSFYFAVRSLDVKGFRNTFLMLAFSFISLLSHSLTGVMSLSIVLLASAVRLYKRENIRSPITARISLSFSFLFSVSVLPLSLIYLRYLRSITNTSFTLDKLNELPLEKIVGLILIGELSSGFDLATIILVLTGPVLAFLCMLYLLFSKRGNDYRYTTSFFFLAFLILLIDYRVLKLFMEGVPFNEERLWVFRDFLAAPFAALSIYGVVSSLKTLIKKTLPQGASFVSFRTLSRIGVLRVLCLLAVVNVAVPVIAGGWAAVSLNAAYPRIAPLQTTWYELEAATYIERNTEGRYVVICDVWGIYAGEAIVGVNNPRAYYFTEFNRTGNDLFVSMKNEPSSHWLLQAMDLTDTTVAYFIISRPRLGAEEFSAVVSKAMQNGLQVFGPPEGFGNGELYVFAHEKT
jgi:hypothetical protein